MCSATPLCLPSARVPRRRRAGASSWGRPPAGDGRKGTWPRQRVIISYGTPIGTAHIVVIVINNVIIDNVIAAGVINNRGEGRRTQATRRPSGPKCHRRRLFCQGARTGGRGLPERSDPRALVVVDKVRVPYRPAGANGALGPEGHLVYYVTSSGRRTLAEYGTTLTAMLTTPLLPSDVRHGRAASGWAGRAFVAHAGDSDVFLFHRDLRAPRPRYVPARSPTTTRSPTRTR